MITEEDILNKLKNDIKNKEDEINNKEAHNKKNRHIRNIINIGIKLDDILPYAVSAALLFPAYKSLGHTPLMVDTYPQKSYIEMIDSSNGDHFQNKVQSNDIFSSVKYSTRWEINNYGFYERIETTYILNENIDLNNIEYILKMNKTQLDQTFYIMDTEIITEAREEDLNPLYNEDAIVITRVINTNETVIKNEKFETNFFTTLMYLITTYILGKGLKEVKKIIFQEYVKDYLEIKAIKYQEINERRIERLKQILELKKENLSLLSEETSHGKVKIR